MRAGNGWERLLIGYHRTLAERGAAMVHKIPEDIRRKNPVDFGGTLAPHGRAVWFDAKETRSRLPSLSLLAHHQGRHLAAHHERGAVAGIALRCPLGCFWLPWSAIGPIWEATPAAAVDPREVGAPFDLAWTPDGGVVGEGWLPCLR